MLGAEHAARASRAPRRRSALNSLVRWCGIGTAIAAWTSGGIGVGPGVSRIGVGRIDRDATVTRRAPRAAAPGRRAARRVRRSSASPARRRIRAAPPCPRGTRSACAGFAATTSSTTARSAPWSAICSSPRSSHDRARVAPALARRERGEHLLRARRAERAVAHERDQLRERGRAHRRVLDLERVLVQVAPRARPCTQLAAAFGSPARRRELLEVGRRRRRLVQHLGVLQRQSELGDEARARAPPAARAARRAGARSARPTAPSARGRARGSSGSRRASSFERSTVSSSRCGS